MAPQDADDTPDGPPERLAQRVLSGAAALTAGQIVLQLAVFLRSVIVLRTLTKLDFGIAATFALSIQFVEMSANMNVERLLVQADDGDEVRFQRTAQFMRCAQGVLVAGVLFLLAPVLAELFSVPEAVWAYRLLALAPLANAFTHFDSQRFMRTLRYGPDVMARAGGQVASLALVAVLAPFVTDYRLMLWALLFQPVAQAALTHVVAERRYGWAWNGAYFKRLFAFGWPLTLNGFLMYLVVQGDRLLIGSAETVVATAREWVEPLVTAVRVYDKTDLADYATAFTLCWMPVQFLTGTLGSLVFPILSREHKNPVRFEEKYRLTAGVFSVFATLMGSGLIIGGTAAVVLLFEEKYRGVEAVIGLIATMQAFRIVRIAPTAASLALADSRILLYANLGRGTAFLGGVAATLAGAHLGWIAASGVVAEVLATVIAVLALRRKHGVRAQPLFRPAIFTIVVLGGAFAVSLSGWYSGDIASLLVMFVYLAVTLGAAYLFFPQAAPMLKEMIAAKRANRTKGS